MILYAGLDDGRLLALGDGLKVSAQVVLDDRPVQAILADAAGVAAVTLGGHVKILSAALLVEREVNLQVPLVAVARTLVDGTRAIAAGAASAAIIGLDVQSLAQIAHARFAPHTLTGLVAVSAERMVIATWQAYVEGASFSGLPRQVFSPFNMSVRPKSLVITGGYLLAPTSAGTLLVYDSGDAEVAPRSATFSSGPVQFAAATLAGQALVLTEDGTLWQYDVANDVRTKVGTVLANATALAATDKHVFVSNAFGEIAAYEVDAAAEGERSARTALINVRAKPLALAIGP